LTIVNSTVAANTAAVVAPVSGGTAGTPFGGGIDNNTSETPGDLALDVYNTLDATNTAAGSPDFKGTAAIANSNLLGDGTGAVGFGVVSDNNQVGTSISPINPLFAVAGLIGNGGNTNTVTLQTGSPALAAGNVAAATAAGLTTDQRGTGFSRIVNGAVDIGAVETQAAATNTSVIAVPNPAAVGASVTFTAVVSPAGGATGTPTGTVQFKDGGTSIGPAETLSLAGGVYQASFSTSSLALGGHTITAVYSGDTNFSTSTSPSVTETISAATTSTSLVANPNPAPIGAAVTFTAIVSPAGGATGTPTGTVQFKDGGSAIGPAETLSLTNGVYQAAYTTSSLTLGSHTITAVYSGDGNFSTSTSPSVSESIGAASTNTSLVAAPNPASVGQNVLFTAIVSLAGGGVGTPTGTVQFKDGGSDIGPAETLSLVSGAYQATFNTSSLTLGSHTITAVYSGDANFNTSTSPNVSEIIGNGTQIVDLSSDYNLTGITTDGTSFGSGLDGQGNALSETQVGRSLAWNGITFPIAAPNVNNVVQSVGQSINLPAGNYSSLSVLATGTNGNQVSQTFVINYLTGSPTTVVQSISDWHTPQNYSGESIALTTSYRNTSTGGRDGSGPFVVYGYSIAVDPTRTVESVTLPNDSNVKILSIAAVAPVAAPTGLMAIAGSTTTVNLSWTAGAGPITGYNVYRGTTAGGEAATPIATLPPTATSYTDSGRVAGNTYYYTVKAINYPAVSAASTEASLTMPTSGLTTQVDLSSDFNLLGISANGAHISGGLDGAGNTYSANVLGTTQTVNGITYTIGQGGSNNVVQATGQIIGLPLSSSYATLNVLATGVNGNQPSQTFTVNYTNGTSQTFNQSISDWHTPQGYTGEAVAVSASYRNTSNGGQDNNGPFDIYGYAFALTVPAGFSIQSITLPADPHVGIVAITVS
jgi:hypothetical protein